MYIAEKLAKTNRAEYLLYLWQVEDVIRGFQCDKYLIKEKYLSQFNYDDFHFRRMVTWYNNLADQMVKEHVVETGHLEMCEKVLHELEEIHEKVLKMEKRFPYYAKEYFHVKPYIEELQQRLKDHYYTKREPIPDTEIRTCFEFLYGIILLRVQKRPINLPTQQAITDISKFLGQLSEYYFMNEKKPLRFW